VFNLWIYDRRPVCSARMLHGGSAAYNPAGFAENGSEEPVMYAVAVLEQRVGAEDNVLPFQAPQDAAQRETQRRGGATRRNRPKGRGKGSSTRD